MVPVELVAALRDLGLVVVTQPSLVAARGDQYLADVDADDVAHLWRCGSLLAAGVGVAAGSDAPYGDADPWRAIAAARDRTTAVGRRARPRRADPGPPRPRPVPRPARRPRRAAAARRRRRRPPTCACSPSRSTSALADPSAIDGAGDDPRRDGRRRLAVSRTVSAIRPDRADRTDGSDGRRAIRPWARRR